MLEPERAAKTTPIDLALAHFRTRRSSRCSVQMVDVRRVFWLAMTTVTEPLTPNDIDMTFVAHVVAELEINRQEERHREKARGEEQHHDARQADGALV